VNIEPFKGGIFADSRSVNPDVRLALLPMPGPLERIARFAQTESR
jgi:hypothetical protein